MIYVAIGSVAVALLAGTACAAPEIIPMKNGVTFRHKAHMLATHTCRPCHEAGPGKIEGFGKEWAHKNCKGCHGEQNAGPYHCAGCHVKVYDQEGPKGR
ncbi:cytochrome c3 family protein [Oryzomonas japonica]|uniref:Cytochrome c3 family protein n=2 Tax=Oryzomonas japonica TaxID=2603858 RepID=A0A7J4ZS18_9BACT|nr:cytochrome c3 family protein [Oryzomonas japonica]